MRLLERRHEGLLPFRAFLNRQALFLVVALGVLGISLYGGMAGFHYLERLNWLDSLLNAAMLLGGEGPIEQPATVAGKLFASFYAVYSGVVFLLAFGILITPVAHRVFHHFHLPVDDEPAPAQKKAAPRAKKAKR
jgi:hypothetical protein